MSATASEQQLFQSNAYRRDEVQIILSVFAIPVISRGRGHLLRRRRLCIATDVYLKANQLKQVQVHVPPSGHFCKPF